MASSNDCMSAKLVAVAQYMWVGNTARSIYRDDIMICIPTMTDQNKQADELICHDWQVPGSEFICHDLSTFLIFTGGEHICLD